MRPVIAFFLAFLGLAAAEDSRYELSGRIVPECDAVVSLHGATTPFTATTQAGAHNGKFRFRGLLAGTYTLAVFVPERGETRRTVEVGPGVADSRRRVEVRVEISEKSIESQDAPKKRALVSTRELSISERARKEYREAQKCLSQRAVPDAIAHLERAVEISPQFSAAWNNLGTIAYQSRRFADAETYFRRAAEQNPAAFEPLVNLGGVLLTAGKLDEALQYNQAAVRSRPNDALANSQLGMTYFAMDNLGPAGKYLEIAKRLDPAHFSHPQLTLAAIYSRRHDQAKAAAALEDFLRRHPDSPRAPELRAAIAKMRAGDGRPQ